MRILSRDKRVAAYLVHTHTVKLLHLPLLNTSTGMEVPRLDVDHDGIIVPKELVDDAVRYAFLELGYTAATDNQAKAILEFLKGRDVFVSLPTGEGKSLCFVSLPYVFDYIRHHHFVSSSQHPSICAVVSPLTSLMKDQVAKYSSRGLKCAYIGDEQDNEIVKSGVVAGDFQLIYMSPESLLCVLKWREMFRSTVYQENLIAIVVDEAHCVEKW